ncbi:MAG TPA: hypothetical protein VHD69_01485 [Candidatus Paceibacterota bacterium]|jgi:hypothetical protein|nr:hypothetical protein [Candidatus Paceibacterota bacterium]
MDPVDLLSDLGFRVMLEFGARKPHLAMRFFTFFGETFAFDSDGDIWSREGELGLEAHGFIASEPLLWEPEAWQEAV